MNHAPASRKSSRRVLRICLQGFSNARPSLASAMIIQSALSQQDQSLGIEIGQSELQYRILGELLLPDPAACGLEKCHQKLAYSLRPLLTELETRDMTSVSTILILDGKASDDNLGIDDRGFQLHRAFEDFKSLECQTWAQLGRCVDESLLVKPSGLTTSTLAHYLHEPSYTTSRIANGETADITNGCLAMIMGNAFRKDETLVFDHMHRRSDQSRGLEEYPTQIIDRHEAFTRQILESSQAKVIIMYGKKVQERIMGDPNYQLTILPLWDMLDGYYISIDHESNYKNADKEFIVRRILLFAAHPQRLFYEPLQSEISRRQDVITFMATCMAATDLPCRDQYYANKLWRQNMRESFLRNKILGLAVRSLAQTSDSRIKEQQTTSIPDPLQTRSFDESRHSDKALQSLETEIPTRRRRRPKPDWYDSLLEAIEDIHVTLPPTVQSWCIHCRERTELSQQRSVFVDDKPRWTLGLTRPLYIERTPVCTRCHELGLPAARFVPVDESLPSMPYNNLALFQKSFGKSTVK